LFLRRTILSTFFSSTHTATDALYAEFKIKSYYNFGFHLDAFTSLFCHILRALYNLTAFTLRVLITPFYILNPFVWPSLPSHCLNLVDDLWGFAISLASIALHPLIIVCRTMTSIIRGYEEHSDYDWGVDAEEEDLTRAMTIF
jgi:hypothetical protein